MHAPDDSHQDHRAVASAVAVGGAAAVRVVHYQSPSTLGFTPSVFVDVTGFLSGKLAALRAHASQVEASAMVEPDAVVAAARYWGSRRASGTPRPSPPPGSSSTSPAQARPAVADARPVHAGCSCRLRPAARR